MSRFIDMTGWKMWEHGIPDSRWTVIEAAKDIVQPNGKQIKMWKCICRCGVVKEVNGTNLRSGNSKSCGCLSIEKSKNNTFGNSSFNRHGASGTRLYYEWTHIKARCYNINTRNYNDYGGRGIIMCDEWSHSFESFRDWALANGYTDELTIDRIDVNGNYEPSNCRWATNQEQANNKRNNIVVEIDGERKTLKQWCDIYNKDYVRVHSRIKYSHWDIMDAIFLPKNSKKPVGKSVECDGVVFDSIVECANNIGRNCSSVSAWLNGTRAMPKELVDRGLKFTNE